MSPDDAEIPKMESAVTDSTLQGEPKYLSGWKLHIMTAALVPELVLYVDNTLIGCSLFSSLFLATLEVSIVSTSLITISDALQAFGNSSWIVIAYLLTYTGVHAPVMSKSYANLAKGFFIIWAKISDIYGRKSVICLALLIFIIFSEACGAVHSVTQL